MNCPQCGKRVWSDWQTCRYCGLNLRGTSSKAMAIPIAEHPDLKGVGGWLLVFCILLTIGGALFLFAFNPLKAGFLGILDLIRGIVGFVMGIHLWSVGKSALLFLKIYFIVAVCVRILEVLVYLIALVGGTAHNQVDMGVALLLCFISLGITSAWIGYFRYSERVKNTYGSNLFLLS